MMLSMERMTIQLFHNIKMGKFHNIIDLNNNDLEGK